MRRLTMTVAEIAQVFGVGRYFIDSNREQLGGIKCGSRLVFPIAKVAEFFGVEKSEIMSVMEGA